MKACLLLPTRVIVLFGIGLGLYTSIAAQNCTCPQFQIVSELEMVKAGNTVEFEIASADSAVLAGTFTWTTSSGKIVSGQGTRKIVVQTNVEMLTAPRPTPSPRAPAGLNGYIITGGNGRRRLKLTVTANFAEPNCQCHPAEHSVQIGRENLEKNKPADATDLQLSADNLTLPCRPDHPPHPNAKQPSASMVIDVGVTAHDPEDDILVYNYTVSGGRIVGTGAEVKWDLSSVAPGSYTITAGVDDGCGICGKTQTKTVNVEDCNDIIDCQCSTIEISGPIDDILKAGENVFTANVTPGTYDPTYEWSVDGGETVSGQGTPSIRVKFDQQTLKSKKTITVRIGGAPESCACLSEKVVEYLNGRRKL